MKKLLFTLATLILAVGNMSASDENGFELSMDEKAHVGLFFAFSGVDSKVEDENVIVEIYNQKLWITNKTDKTIYLDLAECFTYIYNEDRPLYETKTNKKGQAIVTEDQWLTIAPGQEEAVAYMGAGLGGTYSAYVGKKVRILNDITRKFMGIVDDMRKELERQGTGNSAVRHMTKDESFLTLKAAISYRFSRKEEKSTSIVVETWLSDLIMAKYFTLLPEQQKKERSLAAKEVLPAMICTGAESPFEYEEEKSPILSYDISINLKKGEFTLGEIVTRETKTNIFRIFASVYTMGLVSPITTKNKNQFNNKMVIKWLGNTVDFSKIKDDKEGSATFGKKDKVTVTNE